MPHLAKLKKERTKPPEPDAGAIVNRKAVFDEIARLQKTIYRSKRYVRNWAGAVLHPRGLTPAEKKQIAKRMAVHNVQIEAACEDLQRVADQARAEKQDDIVAYVVSLIGWAVNPEIIEAPQQSAGAGDVGGELKPKHNDDFTMVNWFGTEYVFSLGLQAGAIRELWKEWEKSGLGLHQSTISERIDAERANFRLPHVFRDHPAYGLMIQSCGDGKYRLANGGDKPQLPLPRRKARKPKAMKAVLPVQNNGLSERALRAKRKFEAEYAAANSED